ncbi:synaptopodin 2-like protein [Amia ocellicauda]|uniref:synaptopodin 2-like protein n=1 Tax=Amia ocellicauda TaxID=2972642 RepID=UPI00346436A4
MVAEEVVITLAGGAPWGFRLQGGAEHKKPLQVAKVRKRSKACRAGLCEGDELLSINDQPCGGLSHAQAMNLIDSSPGLLHIRVKRAPAGFQSVVLLTRSPSPRIDKEYRAALRALSPPGCMPCQSSRTSVTEIHRGAVLSPTGRGPLVRSPDPMAEERVRRECLTSPPDSEAYYGETDSDADTVHEKQRRQKRRSPNSSPAKTSGRTSPEETSEMSGYESAPDARPQPPGQAQFSSTLIAGGKQDPPPGVAKREVVYQPAAQRAEASFSMWKPQTEVLPLAEISTENSSVSTDDQSPRDGQGTAEVDSGFQEPPSLPPLVSPERARGALLLASRKQLVPMVGPVDNPVDEELTVTYMDKAKQAKLHRSESVQDKQVKEARTKCRTIASLLTDAPNPHSKGVLMFKKRRQRAKKYTLISFGSVDEAQLQGDDEDDEDGVFPTSESEIDEDGFAAAADADTTWDSDYLDILERKTPVNTATPSPGPTESPGLTGTSGKGAQLFEQQRKRAEEHVTAASLAQMPEKAGTPKMQPTTPTTSTTPSTPPNFGMMNGDFTPASRASMVMSPPSHPLAPIPATQPAVISAQLQDMSPSSVLNRTARPFTPGLVSTRASTASVVFRPSSAKKTPTQPPTASVPAPFSPPPPPPPPAHKPAISTASLYIPPRSAPAGGPPTVFSPPPSVAASPFSPPPTPVKPFPSSLPSPAVNSPRPIPQIPSSLPPQAMATPSSFTPVSVSSMAPTFLSPSSAEAMVSREQRISVPAARTGILQEARRRNTKKPMFSLPEEKKNNSPNPELLSLVQNLDERPKVGGEAGFESGPEEDYLNLGAEACNFMQAQKHKMPPPVAPKPHVHFPEVPQLGGKGGELFARRQSRMDRFVVDAPPPPASQPMSPGQPRLPSPTPSLPAHWKYSPNIRAPPPIGYNPLLSPSCPPGAQRGAKVGGATKTGTWSGRKPTTQKEGIRAIDVMRRQPYQLNPAMFSFGNPAQAQQQHQTQPPPSSFMMGSSLTPPKQIPVKATRVYEIKRFSTPTPMSAPTSLTPTVIAPRSATTLGEPLCRSDICSPPPIYQRSLTPNAPLSPPPVPAPITVPSRHVQAPIPAPAPAPTYPAFQTAKQYQSAPELSPLPGSPSRAAATQGPKPRFQPSRIGIQANVWRPGSLHY